LDLILFYFIVDAKMPLSPSTTEEPAYLRDDPGLHASPHNWNESTNRSNASINSRRKLLQ
jgi:hypothetical protein